MSPFEFMWRDLELLGSFGTALIILAPLLSVVFAILRIRLALFPLLGCVILGAGWYGYYAVEMQNPGFSGVVMLVMLMLGIWGFLIVSGGRLLVRWKGNGGRDEGPESRVG